jgi:hypothetical protein
VKKRLFHNDIPFGDNNITAGDMLIHLEFKFKGELHEEEYETNPSLFFVCSRPNAYRMWTSNAYSNTHSLADPNSNSSANPNNNSPIG